MIYYCMQYLTRQNVLPIAIDLDIFISIASWLLVEETWSRYERFYIQLDLNYRWRIQGSGPGRGGGSPFIFRPNWGAKGRKIIFGDLPPPSPPPYLKFWTRHWLLPVFTGMATDRTRTPEKDFTKTRNEERERTREAREQKIISTLPLSVSSLPILPFFILQFPCVLPILSLVIPS